MVSGPLLVNGPSAALAIAAAACALVAPAVLVALLSQRPALAAAADAYRAAASCSGPAARGLPPPAGRIPQSMLSASACTVIGAMVLEKDTISQGAARSSHVVFGLRTDEGATIDAALVGNGATDLWNGAQPGDRVIVQIYAGLPVLVGDGTRTVQTEDNPVWKAANNALAFNVSCGVFAVEIGAGVLLAVWWRRSRAARVS